MESIVLNGGSKENLKLLIELAKKLGFTAKHLTDAEKEDLAMIEAIKKGRTNKFVEVESFIEKMKK